MSHDTHLKLADDDDRDLGRVDPDFALITDYLAEDLSAEEMAAVERRLREDEEFFDKVWPIVRVWDLPHYARQRRARARRKAQGFAPERDLSPAAPPLVIVPRRPRFSAKTNLWIGLAAAAVIAVTVGVYKRPALRNPLVVSFAHGGDRASVADIRDSVQVETGPGETKILPLAGGSRLIMRENSRITYHLATREIVRMQFAAYDGELAIELTSADGYLGVRTSAGRAIFMPGTYALKCAPGCAAMLVTVGVGATRMYHDEGTADGVTLKTGEKGRVPKHGHPEKVTTAGGDWPPLASEKAP